MNVVVSDSQVIISWDDGNNDFHSLLVDHRKSKVRKLISSFTSITFRHIYHEINFDADQLSKVGIGEIDGLINYEVWLESSLSLSASLAIDYEIGP